jgi:hypothetical protein
MREPVSNLGEFTDDKCVSHKQRKRRRLERAALALKPTISGEGGRGLWLNVKPTSAGPDMIELI